VPSSRRIPWPLSRGYGNDSGRCVRGREGMRTDWRGDGGAVRPTSVGAPRGREARLEGCGSRTDGRGPASRTYDGVRRHGARGRDVAFQRCFNSA
jgi:hypothetical protein